MKKKFRIDQSRKGNADRRRLEFDAIVHAVKKNKARFIARLERNLSPPLGPLGCRHYLGRTTNGGYPCINFRFPRGSHLTIAANRVFSILRNCAPIPLGMDSAHTDGCVDRKCVKHLMLQPFQINARTQGPYAGVPF